MGILSDIAKGLKNTIRGVGRIIKKTTKPLRKAIRAILKPLKPIGKIFNKLGFIGTIALSFLLPMAGTAIATWLSSWGAGMAKFVNAISKAISWVTKPIKFVRDSITGVLKQGMNRLGQAFGFDAPGKMAWKAGGEKIFDAAGNVTGTTTGHFAAGATGGGTLTDSLTRFADRIFKRSETTTTSITGEPLGLEGLPGQQIQPPKQGVWSAEELEFKAPEFDPLTSADVVVPKLEVTKPTLDWTDTAAAVEYPSVLPTTDKGLFGRIGEKLGAKTEAFGNRPVGGWAKTDEFGNQIYKTYQNQGWKQSQLPKGVNITDQILSSTGSPIAVPKVASWGQVGTAGKYGMGAYSAYTAFKGAPSYAEEFYNPNIGMAGAMLDETQQTTFLDDLFTDGTRSYNTDAMFAEAQNEYYTAFGAAPSKNWWEQTQGGMSFEDFLYDFTLLPNDYSDEYLTA